MTVNINAAPERTPVPPFDLVIFGASGDLALRKLYPAMAHRDNEGVLPPDSRVIAMVHQERHIADLPREIEERLRGEGLEGETIDRFMARLTILQADANIPASFAALAKTLAEAGEKSGEQAGRVRAFYLSTAPDLFVPICRNLAAHHLLDGEARVILEKPIGSDLKSARVINDAVVAVIPESRTYRIDHYLGKETVQNLLVLRFANTLFERSWSSRRYRPCPDHGRGNRGAGGACRVLRRIGALRDMVQNHVLQLLCLFASEPPNMLEADAVRDEKTACSQGAAPDHRARMCCAPACAGNMRKARSTAMRARLRRGTRQSQRHRDLRRAEMRGRHLALGGRAVLPAHRQAAGAALFRDRRRLQAGAALDFLAALHRRLWPPTASCSGFSRTMACNST